MATAAIIAGLGAVGSVVSGFASFRQNRFQAKIAERNAVAARQQAAAEEARFRRDRQRRLGAIRARSGGQIAGSPLEVLADQAMIAEEDALLIRHGGAVAAQEQRLRAQQLRQAGTSALIGGILGGGAQFGASAMLANATGQPFFKSGNFDNTLGVAAVRPDQYTPNVTGQLDNFFGP